MSAIERLIVWVHPYPGTHTEELATAARAELDAMRRLVEAADELRTACYQVQMTREARIYDEARSALRSSEATK